MSIVLFEDGHVSDMYPVTLTRPAFYVTCAGHNLFDVVKKTGKPVAVLVREHFHKDGEKVDLGQGPHLFLNASIMPDTRYGDRLAEIWDRSEPFMSTSGQRIAAAFLPESAVLPEDITPESVDSFLLDQNLPLDQQSAFRLFNYPHQIVAANLELFPSSIQALIDSGKYREIRKGVYSANGAVIADSAVFHTEDGPILLGGGVRIMDFSYLCGPLIIGRGSRVIERSSVKDCTTVGETCKIGGEVEACVIEAYTNKQHHGFLGHAYVGSWVNLGAGTSTSDLKNTYGQIRIDHRGRKLETGMQFFGCVIGDYSKTAINTSLFTGKIIGTNSMLYGYVSQNVGSFTNYAASFGQITECTLEQALETQKRMFARRDREQTDDDRKLLTAAYHLTAQERRFSTDPLTL